MNEKRIVGRRSPVLIATVIALAILALSVTGYLLETYVESRRDQAEIQKRLDAIRASGEPVTAQDLAKLYPNPPPEYDALLLLKPSLSALIVPEHSTNLPFFATNLPQGTTPLEKSSLEEVEACVNKNRGAFDLVSFERIQGAWIGSGFENGFSNLTEVPIPKIMAMGRLLCLKVVFQAGSGDSKQATKPLIQAMTLASIWRNDLPIHIRARTVAQTMICDSFKFTINHLAFSDADLKLIEQSFPKSDTNSLTDFFIDMRCQNIWDMERIRRNPNLLKMDDLTQAAWINDVSFWFWSISGHVYRNSDFETILDWDTKRIAASRLPIRECLAELQHLKPGKKNSAAVILLEAGAYGYQKIARDQTEASAYLQATRTAIAIERWRLVHRSRIPDSLNQLVPDFLPSIPDDPFDGQPLRYKKLARGYVIYSIGSDFTDDGGKEKPAGARETDHYDITFTVER